jgi:glycosyltransferase involved in cell wall biosynthesis
MASRLAIYWPGARIGVGANLVGVHVANVGLFRALARYGGFEQLDVLSHATMDPAELAEDLLAEDLVGRDLPAGAAAAGALVPGSALDVQRLAETGAMLRGSPDLVDLAWLRRQTLGDRAYSLIGTIHTIAPPGVRGQIAGAAVGPIQPWDALICTSPSVRSAMERMFEEWGAYIAERFGGTRWSRPHLPLIPLGVDGARLAALADRPAVRAAVRERLGLAPDDVLVLWVGRLSFFEKAFPQPMFRAVQEAARAAGVRVHFAMAGWFPDPVKDRQMYEQAARAYAPAVPVHFLDGNDRAGVAELWAAADVFLSLVDNVQETFGIAPVEAMAAGLPVVVSDWDGYRATVCDGQEGFLVPTLLGSAGRFGRTLAIRHGLQIDSYQSYAGMVAQSTAVHVGRAADALAALIRSPGLRRRMGQAGRARVREAFDWPVVAAQVNALVDDLAAIRAAAPAVPGDRVLNPVAGDPFRAFAGFATGVLSSRTPLAVRPGVDRSDLERAAGVALDNLYPFWRASPQECARILDLVAGGRVRTVGELLAECPEPQRHRFEQAVLWMAKLGLLDWLPDTETLPAPDG